MIGNLDHLNTVRQRDADGLHFCIQRGAETQHITGRRHRDSQPDGGFAVDPVNRLGRLGVFPTNGGNIRQRKVTIVNMQRDGT